MKKEQKEQKVGKKTFRSLFSWATKSVQQKEKHISSGEGTSFTVSDDSSSIADPIGKARQKTDTYDQGNPTDDDDEVYVKKIQIVYRNGPKSDSKRSRNDSSSSPSFFQLPLEDLDMSQSQPCLSARNYDHVKEWMGATDDLAIHNGEESLAKQRYSSSPTDSNDTRLARKSVQRKEHLKVIESDELPDKRLVIKIHPKDRSSLKSLRKRKTSKSVSSMPDINQENGQATKDKFNTYGGARAKSVLIHKNSYPGMSEKSSSLKAVQLRKPPGRKNLRKRQTWEDDINGGLSPRSSRKARKQYTCSLEWSASKAECKACKLEAGQSVGERNGDVCENERSTSLARLDRHKHTCGNVSQRHKTLTRGAVQVAASRHPSGYHSDTSSVQESVCLKREADQETSAIRRGYSSSKLDRALSWTDNGYLELPSHASRMAWSHDNGSDEVDVGVFHMPTFSKPIRAGPILQPNKCRVTPVETWDIWEQDPRLGALDTPSLLVNIVDTNAEMLPLPCLGGEVAMSKRTRMAFKQCQCVSSAADEAVLMAVMMSNVRTRGAQCDIGIKEGA